MEALQGSASNDSNAAGGSSSLLIYYYGHTSTLCKGLVILPPFHPRFHKTLCNLFKMLSILGSSSLLSVKLASLLYLSFSPLTKNLFFLATL